MPVSPSQLHLHSMPTGRGIWDIPVITARSIYWIECHSEHYTKKLHNISTCRGERSAGPLNSACLNNLIQAKTEQYEVVMDRLHHNLLLAPSTKAYKALEL